jgi:uncharacterized membrane protein YoaK (UPF0700 family)
MTTHERPLQVLAILLAALAGWVDAFGFMATGGFFVSFMSGNSTRMGIGIAARAHTGLIAAGLIGCFLLGVVAGAVAGHRAGVHRPPVVLGLVALLLAAAAAAGMAGSVAPAAAAMALAMGAENNVFTQDGEVKFGVTYMTGSLVKLGQRVASALLGTGQGAWLPYLLLWMGFVAGVVGGAVSYPRLGLAGLWGPALAAAVLAGVATRIRPTAAPLAAGRVG